MKRKLLALTILLVIVTVVSAVLIYADYMAYEAYKQAVLEEYPALEPWVDLPLYYEWNPYFIPAVCSLTGMWILYVLFLAYRRFGKAAMATALSLIFAISFQPAIRVVEPQTTSVEGGSTVDVLVMCDEEFLAMGYNLTEVAMFI